MAQIPRPRGPGCDHIDRQYARLPELSRRECMSLAKGLLNLARGEKAPLGCNPLHEGHDQLVQRRGDVQLLTLADDFAI